MEEKWHKLTSERCLSIVSMHAMQSDAILSTHSTHTRTHTHTHTHTHAHAHAHAHTHTHTHGQTNDDSHFPDKALNKGLVALVVKHKSALFVVEIDLRLEHRNVPGCIC